MPEFDQYAKEYKGLINDCIKNLSDFDRDYFCEYKIETIKNSINSSPTKILDFGCGDGLSEVFLKKHFPKAEVTGLDISSESIEIAQNRKIPDSTFVLYDGFKLPFEDNSFDLIFSAGVFHHIDEKTHLVLMKEINRVLKNNGKLFIFEHNPINPFTRKVVKNCAVDNGVKLIFANKFKCLYKKAGFKKAKINYTLFVPRYKIFQKLFFVEKFLKWFPIGAQYYIEATKT